jgi:hypothetical protein
MSFLQKLFYVIRWGSIRQRERKNSTGVNVIVKVVVKRIPTGSGRVIFSLREKSENEQGF